jgi:hypothetical protein
MGVKGLSTSETALGKTGHLALPEIGPKRNGSFGATNGDKQARAGEFHQGVLCGLREERRALGNRPAFDCHCALKAFAPGVLTIGGGFHLPVSASGLGP